MIIKYPVEIIYNKLRNQNTEHNMFFKYLFDGIQANGKNMYVLPKSRDYMIIHKFNMRFKNEPLDYNFILNERLSSNISGFTLLHKSNINNIIYSNNEEMTYKYSKDVLWDPEYNNLYLYVENNRNIKTEQFIVELYFQYM